MKKFWNKKSVSTLLSLALMASFTTTSFANPNTTDLFETEGVVAGNSIDNISAEVTPMLIDENMRIKDYDSMLNNKSINTDKKIELVELEEITERPVITPIDNYDNQTTKQVELSIDDKFDSYEYNNNIQDAHNMWNLGPSYERYVRGTLNQEHGDIYYGSPYDVQMDTDWFKFTVNPKDGFSNDVALRLKVMDGMDVNMYIHDENGNFITGYRCNSSNPVILKFSPRSTAKDYYVEITPHHTTNSYGEITYVAEQSPTRQYTFSLLDYSRTSSYTTNRLNPSSVSSSGLGSYSQWATIDLTSNSSLPDSASVRGVTVKGTFKNPVSSRIAVLSNEVLLDEQILLSKSNIYDTMVGFRDSFIPVKNLWGVCYMTEAWNSTSSIQNLTLDISYKYDLFEDYQVYIR